MNFLIEPGKVYKLWHMIELQDQHYGPCLAEMQLENDILYLISEWQTTHDGLAPRIRIPLDIHYVEPSMMRNHFRYMQPLRAREIAKLYIGKHALARLTA